jgi:hypothetical protein
VHAPERLRARARNTIFEAWERVRREPGGPFSTFDRFPMEK